MRVLRGALFGLALLVLSACGDGEWLHEDAQTTGLVYGAPSRVQNDALAAAVEGEVAREMAQDNGLDEELLSCRHFSYRAHVEQPNQYLVRCNRHYYLTVRDGEVIESLYTIGEF